MDTKPIICADVIALYDSKFVIVERLGSVPGLALPGGKQEKGERLSLTASREYFEETGLKVAILEVLGTYADKDRDPRGNYVSTVFIGVALGTPKEETGKTRVLFLSKEEIEKREKEFVFDHFQVLKDYFNALSV